MKHLKQKILVCLICAAGFPAVRGEDLSAAIESAAQAMKLLQARGISAEPVALETVLLKNLVRAADPGGALLESNEIARLERDAQGLWYAPTVHFAMTNGTPVLIEPLPKDGRTGDVLELVDGKDMRGLPQDEIRRRLAGGGEEVQLTVRRNGSTEHEISLKRTPVPVPPVAAAEMLNPETGYVKLYGCFPGTADALQPVLLEWKTSGVYGVVLDLRSAGGASREEACRTLSLFMPAKGELFSIVPLAGEPGVCLAGDTEPAGLPMMVLVDKDTAGAAELLAAGLQNRETGSMLLGRKTRGDFLLRETLRLNDARAMHVATRTLKFPEGRECRANEGLVPDIVIEETKAGRAAVEEGEIHPRLRNDAALRRACDLLKGLRALNIKIREDSKTPEN